MDSKSIFETIEHIKKHHKNLDLIIFIKNGKEKILNLFKFPKFLMKNKTIVSGKILNNSIIQDNIFYLAKTFHH